jgi:hypothetical protein
MNRVSLGFIGAMMRQNRPKFKRELKPAVFKSFYGDFQRRLTAMHSSNKGSLGVDAWGNDLSSSGSSGSSGATESRSTRKKVVKKHSRVKDLPKSATKHAKGASLLTRRIPGATLT